MKAEQLMEAIIANAQEGRNLTVRAVRSGTATKEGDRFLLVPVTVRKIAGWNMEVLSSREIVNGTITVIACSTA